MALSNELASQYAKITIATNKQNAPKESTVYGTVWILDGKTYVQFDGSEQMTPVETTTSISEGDRVIVTIKNHSATVTGNLKDPSVSGSVLQGEVEKLETVIADKIIANEGIFGEIEAIKGRFDELDATYATIDHLEANYAKIDSLDAEYAKIEDLEATYATIYYVDATYATIQDLKAVNAKIDTLDVENLDATYVKIDWANIGEADIENFYAKFGMIEDAVISDGKVTGKLAAVEINADYITSGTLQTDRLLVKGEDGLYYKLNIEGGATVTEKVSEEDLQNGLHGSVIIAKSITVNEIAVDDLYAFNATIGGVKITDHSLYSGVKESAANTTPGFYLDGEGQVNFGNASDFVKFYKTTNDQGDESHKLEISASSIKLQVDGESSDVATSETVSGVEGNLQETDKKMDAADGKIGRLSSQIELLESCIKTLVTDSRTGASLMKQEGDKWTFDISGIEQNLGNANETLQTLMSTVGALASVSDGLALAVANLETTSEYVWITTYEDEPCLALGESDTTNGLFITNTRIIFIKEAGEPTYIDKDGLYTGRLEVGGEFRQKDYVWAVRANGNYGLSWKQVVLTAITVTYVGAENIKVGTDITKLSGIIVKGTYSNGRIRSIPNYEISGEIVEGKSAITVKVNEFTATFTVNGVDDSYVLGPSTTYSISITSSTAGINPGTSIRVYYSDEVEIVDGKATLKNPEEVIIYRQDHADYNQYDIELLYGKYACAKYKSGDVYYVDPNASFSGAELPPVVGITSYVYSLSPAYKVEVVLVDTVLESISVNYTGGPVSVGTPVSALTGITVTAKYSDGSTVNVVGYSISGSIYNVDDNQIMVAYNGKHASFTVKGVANSSGGDTGGGDSGGTTDNLVMRTGTTTTNVINTGLSNIKYFTLTNPSLTSAGLLNLVYDGDIGTAKYTYCSNYQQYTRTGGILSGLSYVSINGGRFEWTGTGSYAIASNKEYTWVAIGEA